MRQQRLFPTAMAKGASPSIYLQWESRTLATSSQSVNATFVTPIQEHTNAQAASCSSRNPDALRVHGLRAGLSAITKFRVTVRSSWWSDFRRNGSRRANDGGLH